MAEPIVQCSTFNADVLQALAGSFTSTVRDLKLPFRDLVSLSSPVITASGRNLTYIKASIIQSLPVLVVFRSASGIVSPPSGLALRFGSPNLNNYASALRGVRPFRRLSWSRHSSLTALGRHESKAFMGFHS